MCYTCSVRPCTSSLYGENKSQRHGQTRRQSLVKYLQRVEGSTVLGSMVKFWFWALTNESAESATAMKDVRIVTKWTVA